ncbi:MAG: HAD family hydrolase [Spirochaetota bacterium]|nr:HAD family hydrolase [Spirochaetota bacterium]
MRNSAVEDIDTCIFRKRLMDRPMDRKCYAFFDVDHTIISGSSGRYLAFRCVREGILPFRNLLKIPLLYFHYRTGILEPEILRKLLQQLEGVPIARMRELSAEIFEQKLKPRLYARAVRLIEEKRKMGRTVVLATSAPESIVRPVAMYLGVDDVVATRFEVRDGKLTGRFDGLPAFGKGKQDKVRAFAEGQQADLSCCSFYSDSHYDLPLLMSVKEPVAVNPDRKLRRTAEKQGWKILKFRKVLGKPRC